MGLTNLRNPITYTFKNKIKEQIVVALPYWLRKKTNQDWLLIIAFFEGEYFLEVLCNCQIMCFNLTFEYRFIFGSNHIWFVYCTQHLTPWL